MTGVNDTKAIRKRANAARYKKWGFGSSLDSRQVFDMGATHVFVPGDTTEGPCLFILHSHGDVLSLCDEVDALRAEIRAMKEVAGVKASEHCWIDYDAFVVCSACGVVRRADGKNKTCIGIVRIGLRAEGESK